MSCMQRKTNLLWTGILTYFQNCDQTYTVIEEANNTINRSKFKSFADGAKGGTVWCSGETGAGKWARKMAGFIDEQNTARGGLCHMLRMYHGDLGHPVTSKTEGAGHRRFWFA